MAVTQLILEQRRHWRMSFGLMTACVIGGVSVSNERGVFVPVGSVGNALAATARAFAAIAAPPGSLQMEPYSLLYPAGRIDSGNLPSAMIARVLEAPAEPFSPAFGNGPFVGPLGQGAPAATNGTPSTPSQQPAQPASETPAPTSQTPAPETTPGPQPSQFTPADSFGAPAFVPNTPSGPSVVTPPDSGPGPVVTPPPTPDVPAPPTTNPPAPPGTPSTEPPPVVELPPDQPVNPNPPTLAPGGNPPDDRGPPGDNPGGENPIRPPAPGVPEPASWAMLIAGFGLIGVVQRIAERRRRKRAAA